MHHAAHVWDSGIRLSPTSPKPIQTSVEPQARHRSARVGYDLDRVWSSAGTKDYDRTLSSRNALKRIGSVFSNTANHRTTQYTQFKHRKHSTTLETPNTGNKQGRCMAKYIRVRLRFRPPLVASPSQPHQARKFNAKSTPNQPTISA